ncbi:MAG: hypothetical protein AABY32_01045 [Nanoarchaeota archaeon]
MKRSNQILMKKISNGRQAIRFNNLGEEEYICQFNKGLCNYDIILGAILKNNRKRVDVIELECAHTLVSRKELEEMDDMDQRIFFNTWFIKEKQSKKIDLSKRHDWLVRFK